MKSPIAKSLLFPVTFSPFAINVVSSGFEEEIQKSQCTHICEERWNRFLESHEAIYQPILITVSMSLFPIESKVQLDQGGDHLPEEGWTLEGRKGTQRVGSVKPLFHQAVLERWLKL